MQPDQHSLHSPQPCCLNIEYNQYVDCIVPFVWIGIEKYTWRVPTSGRYSIVLEGASESRSQLALADSNGIYRGGPRQFAYRGGVRDCFMMFLYVSQINIQAHGLHKVAKKNVFVNHTRLTQFIITPEYVCIYYNYGSYITHIQLSRCNFIFNAHTYIEKGKKIPTSITLLLYIFFCWNFQLVLFYLLYGFQSVVLLHSTGPVRVAFCCTDFAILTHLSTWNP